MSAIGSNLVNQPDQVSVDGHTIPWAEWQQFLADPGSAPTWAFTGVANAIYNNAPNPTTATQAPTPPQGDWNQGDVWDMTRAPADVLASSDQYSATHDVDYYKQQAADVAAQHGGLAPTVPTGITSQPTTQTQATMPSFFTQPASQQQNQPNPSQMLQSPFTDKQAAFNPLYWSNTSFSKH